MSMANKADQRLLEHANRSISVGSKSFAAAARLFDPATRRSAVMLYAWCRYCDDVIDGQEAGHSASVVASTTAQLRLKNLRSETEAVYESAAAESPAFAAFREVALRHAIPKRYATEHLAGFEMDVLQRRYDSIEDTLEYCYHVAGVVGLMMSQVMGAGDELTLDRACDLGIAFQLTNIARDIIDDAHVGRCYLPREWLKELSVPEHYLTDSRYRQSIAILAERLVDLAEPYYASSRAGLSSLPWRSAWAVATACGVYREIGIEVKKRGARAWDSRISTSGVDKLRLAISGLWAAVTSRGRRWPARPETLWKRPR